MPETLIDIHELPARWPEALELANSGAEVIIIDENTHRLRLTPVSPQARTPGLHAGAMMSTDDFDAPLSDAFWMGEP